VGGKMNEKYIFEEAIENSNSKDMEEIAKIRKELSNYDMADFLARVSSLMLIPENQSKSVIFQVMISTALSLSEKDFNYKNKMSYGKFKQIVKRFSNLNRKSMIDPPEFPFVLPLIYHGNYHLFMGASSLAAQDVNKMLKLLHVYRDKLNREIFRELDNLIKVLLNISEQIFAALDIDFVGLKTYSKDNDIKILPSNIMNKYIELVKKNKNDVKKIFTIYCKDLCIRFGEVLFNEIDDFNNQRYYKKPFLIYEESVVLVDITTFIYIIMDRIIKTFYDNESINIFNEYNKLIVLKLEKDYFRMGFQKLNPKAFNIELDKNTIVNESIYLCGNDIVFYNLVLFDTGKDYDNNKDYYIDLDKNYITKIIKYMRKQLENNNFKKERIVTILTPTTIGRNMYYMLNVDETYNLLILSPYEINAIAINERDNSMFLYRYIKSRNKLAYYKKSDFSELNNIALYTQHDNSFYYDDEFDTKETFLFLVGDYSSDYILKSYIKESLHLAKFKNGLSLIEVIKQYDNIFFAPSLLFEKQLNNLIEYNNFYLWIFSDKNISNESYSLITTIIEMISFWLSQFDDIFELVNGIFNINLHFDNDLNIAFYDKTKKPGEIKFTIDGNNLNIHFKDNSLKFFDAEDNYKEKEFISKIIMHICSYYGITVEQKIINKQFEDKYKKKIITMNSWEDYYRLPFKEPRIINENSSDTNLILDDVGLFAKNKLKLNYGKIDDYKVLNSIVEYLYKKILQIITKYNKYQLIEYLYLEFEKNLSELLIKQSTYANDIACHPNKKNKIDNNINELNKTSVALKFLIEIISATSIKGKENISIYELDYALSISIVIINYAYACDVYNYNMAQNTLTLLKSNRIGYKKDFFDRVNNVLKDAKIGRMSPLFIDKREQILEQSNVNKKEIIGFENAFYEEFNFTYKEFQNVIDALLYIAETKDNTLNCIFETNIEEVQKNINNNVNIKSIESIISYLSQKERDDYLTPPEPYKRFDVYPWRNNRELSLNRKPLIQYNNKIIYGYRTLMNSVYFLLEIINNGSLKSRSSKMKKYISDVLREKGDYFNELVFNYLSNFSDLIVDKKVSKINRKKLSDDYNQSLGDIDVLLISMKKKKIMICETKNFELARNMYELHFEYLDMFNPDNKKSFYNKHMKRVEWCKNNIDDIITHYQLPNLKWKIDHCFIVNEPLISNKAMKANVQVYTLEEIEKIIQI